MANVGQTTFGYSAATSIFCGCFANDQKPKQDIINLKILTKIRRWLNTNYNHDIKQMFVLVMTKEISASVLSNSMIFIYLKKLYPARYWDVAVKFI